jgi:hypothetical protein
MRVKKGLSIIVAVCCVLAGVAYAHRSTPKTLDVSHQTAASSSIARKIKTIPTTTPTPTSEPTVPATSSTPTMASVITPLPTPTATPTPANCPALQTQWSQSLAQISTNLRWQLDQGLLSLLSTKTQRNTKIDTYNTALQAAYAALAEQAKSAQCNLGLSAPAIYPRFR